MLNEDKKKNTPRVKIEKLEYYSSSSDGCIWERHPTYDDIVNKINEIIEVINNGY